MIPNYLDVSIRWLSILLLNTFASVMFFKSFGKLLYNLAPRKAKDLWPVLRREKGTISSRSAKALLQLELLSLLFIFLFSFQSKTKRYLPYKQPNHHFNLFSLKSCKIERSKDKLSHRARLPSSTSHVAIAKYSDDRDVWTCALRYSALSSRVLRFIFAHKTIIPRDALQGHRRGKNPVAYVFLFLFLSRSRKRQCLILIEV